VQPRQPRPIPLSASVTARKPPPARRPAARRPAVYRIAFFGDSVSVGFGASARSRTYVADVTRWLEQHGKRVVGTVDAKGGVPVAYWEWAWMPTRLDAAVVELGTNDVRLGTSPAQFAGEYRRLTSRIRAAAPKARLLCLSVWSHPAGAGPDAVINAQIREVCPGTYVDITSFRRLPHVRSSDHFHPNDTGYRLIAQAVESKLKTS
jgi:lysophospholipase L1-like esterase